MFVALLTIPAPIVVRVNITTRKRSISFLLIFEKTLAF